MSTARDALPDERSLATVAHDTSDALALAQTRLRSFAALATLASTVALALGVAHASFGGRHGLVGSLSSAAMTAVAAIAVPGGLWASLRRPRSAGFLRWVDVLVPVSVLVGHAAQMLVADRTGLARFDLLLTLIGELLLLTRAVLVPSTIRSTALVSVIAMAPAVAMATLVGHELASAGAVGAAITTPALVGIWWIATTGVSVLATHVLGRLRARVAASRSIGPYALDRKLGEGGMGEVHLGHHSLLCRPTAIKLLPPEKAGRLSVARFEREVRHTAQLTHPNTVSIYDYGRTDDGTFYYAMEYLPGVDLQGFVDAHGPMDPRRAVHVLSQICGSLGEAHRAGLVHRDVKPANVILCERGGVLDVAKVLDFGLVKHLDGEGPGLTHVRAVLGTPAYMPPEAVKSAHDVDARSDVYAVGALAYFLLAGTPVFDGDSIIAVCAQHLTEEPPPLSGRAGIDVPPALEALVLACLAKEPDARPSDAHELLRRLESCGVAAWTQDDACAWWAPHRASAPTLPETRSLPPSRALGQPKISSLAESAEVVVRSAIDRSSTFRSSRTLPGHA